MSEDPDAKEIAGFSKELPGDRNMIRSGYRNIVVQSADQFAFGVAEELAERRRDFDGPPSRIR